MPQRFAADQHGFFVQLFPGFIFSAGVDITLKFAPRSLVDSVVGDFFDGPCMGAVDVGCIFGAVAVDVSALADVGGVKVFRAPSGYGTDELTIVDSEWSVPSSTMIYATGLKGDVWQALLNRVSYIQKGGVKLSLAK